MTTRPESITATFSVATPFVMRAFRGGAITPKDFHPLSSAMQTQTTYDTFEEMLVTRYVTRVPEELWGEVVAYVKAKDVLPPTAHQRTQAEREAAGGSGPSGSGSGVGARDGAYRSLDDGDDTPAAEDTARLVGANGLAGVGLDLSAQANILKEMRAQLEGKSAVAIPSSLGGAADPSAPVTFVTLPQRHRVHWARIAVHLSRDKARLFLSQEVSFFRLLVHAISTDLAIGLLLSAARTAAVMAQVVVLWVLVRLANGDPSIGEWHPAYRCLLSLILPIGALAQSFGQHNTFHATNNGAIKARSLVLALVYEKISVMTPLYVGSASGVVAKKGGKGAGAGSSSASGADEEMGAVDSRVRTRTAADSDAAALSQPMVAAEVGDGRAPMSNASFANAVSMVADSNPVSTGMLINIVASDANTILEAALMIPLSLSTILDLAACLAWVSVLGGWATAILFLAMFGVFAFQVFCGYRVSANKLAVAAICDQRLRALTEFLSGIQVVKFYAWEANVRDMIKALRGKEAVLLVKGNSWKLIGLTSTFCAPGLFYLCLFGVRSTYASGMDAVTTFTVMALLATNVNRTFQVLPRALTVIGTTVASMKRIASFLTKDVTTGLPTPDATPAQNADSAPPARSHAEGLHIKGDFGWPGFTLRGVDLYCPPRSLTVVVGSVGSGKSTLLQAVMGMCAAMSRDYALRLPPSATRHGANGSIAYVAQEAFIAEATVRDNITFGLAFDEHRYRRVIKACSLVTDLQQWGGDLVEVSGNTLSGGQRQRLSLARACYADADLYVIDDPISAVDATVGRHLLQKCFRGYLSHKTVLLTTHHPAPARFADQVVVMNGSTAPKVRRISAAARESPRLAAMGSPPAEMDEKHLSNVLSRLESESNVSADDMGALGDEDGAAMTSQEQEQDAVLDALLGKARALKVVEAEAIGSVPMSVYMAYCRGGGWILLIFTVVTFLLSQGFRTGGDWWFSAWTSLRYSELSDGQYLGIFAASVVLTIIAACIRTICFGLFTIKASSSLHDRMFEAVIASPLHFFEQVPLGRIMNRFSKDLDYCDDMLPRVLFDLVQLIFLVMGSLSMQIYSVPWFAIAIPVALVIFVLLLRLYMPASRYIKRIESTSRSPSMNAFQTVIAGLTTLRMYGRMADYRAVYYAYCDVTINAMLHSSCMQRWIAVRMDLISSMWALVASVLCAALMFDMGGPSTVGLCLSQSVFLAGLFQFAVRMATETEMMMTSVERLDEYALLPPEENQGMIMDGGRLAEGVANGTIAKKHAQSATALPANWPAGCDIVVKGLTVAHYSNPTVDVLKNLHFTVKAGQRVAVVGRTGAGKSTLLSAFFRTLSVPDDSIKIGGISTTDIDVFSLRSKLGIIPQVPTLFHGTIRYNLDPFGVYTDMEMMGALAKVRLAEYVGARAGLDTPVGEGGGNLSVGQRQLLCAARVLLTGATILFMDEATANIDEETDAQIQQIMREEAARRQMIVITIAHRLNTVMDYDLVLVLSQGRLVEVGNPRALVEAGVGDVMSPVSSAPEGSLADASLGGMSPLEFTTDVQALGERFAFASMVSAMNEAREDH